MNDLVTGLKKRVIPIILFSNYQVVKSREFKDYRVFGNLEQTINVFNQRNIDEIIVLDVESSKIKSKVNLEILKILSRSSLMPFSYGGGIQTIEDIQKCLISGCDKVVINSKCLKDIKFVYEASKVFGSQCIVVSVDYKVLNKDKWKIFSHIGLNTDHIEPQQYIKDLVNSGAGEIILTSVNHEGKMKGYDESFAKIICDEINIPVLVNGGCGSPEHMIKPFTFGVDGVCAGSIFYFSQYSYKDIKDFLIKNKINVRPS